MQASVRSTNPHLGDLPKTFSNDSVHVSREISVVSSRAPTPTMSKTISRVEVENGDSKVPTEVFLPNTYPARTQSNRWSLARGSEKSSVLNRRSTSMRGLQSSADYDLLENNRESMRALSEFLMTREPPPNNFMSIASSDDDKSLSALQKTTNRLFGKNKKKKRKSPRLLQLPDSAVAATTRGGARHIAISIPIEHDHLEKEFTTSYVVRVPKRVGDRQERAPITVLKPVTEARESGSSYLTSARSRDEFSNNVNITVRPPTAAGLEDARPHTAGELETGQLHPRVSRMEATVVTKVDHHRPTKTCVADSQQDMMRQDSQMSDPRHSGGTQYSTATIATPGQGHSREPSSISLAPSGTLISSLKLDLPPRTSSVSKIPASIKADLARTSTIVNEKAQAERPIISPIQANGDLARARTTSPAIYSTSLTSSAKAANRSGGSSPSPSIIYGTAETARSYSGLGVAGPQIVRSLTPRSTAPNKSLPDIPGNQTGFVTRPVTAPPFRTRSAAAIQLKDAAAHYTAANPLGDTRNEAILATRQNRLERVKARKQRDIERSKSTSSRPPLGENGDIPNITRDPKSTSHIITPPRHPKRRSASADLSRRKSAVGMTPIMTVVDLEPYTGYVHSSDLPLTPLSPGILPRSSTKRRSISPSHSHSRSLERDQENTPPRSTSSLISDSDTIPLSPIIRRSPPLSLRSSVLETRRRERREKRNLSLRERDLDERLCKIERDNEVLMRTLQGIAKGFGEFGGLLGGRGNEIGNLRRGERKRREVKGVEPVMRELSREAPRISGDWGQDEF